MESTPFSFILLCLCGVFIFLQLQWVVMGRSTIALSFFLWFGGTFHLLWICRSKVSHLLFKLLLNLDSILIGDAKGGDVEELNLIQDVLV